MKKVMVITGASSGVGETLAKKFVELGWHVVGLARNKDRLLQISSDLGNHFSFMQIDIKNEADVQKTFEAIEQKFGTIDILVNNAAIFKMDQFLNCTFEDINAIIDTNLKGVMYSTLQAISIMKKTQAAARIINIASVASIHGIKNQAIYCASKFGLNGFAEALNQEIIQYNISISTIFPGGINTPLWNDENPYPGINKDQILQCSDFVKTVEYISELEPRIILKNLTIFPSNEWH